MFQRTRYCYARPLSLVVLCGFPVLAAAFSPGSPRDFKTAASWRTRQATLENLGPLKATSVGRGVDAYTIQILMSDTGGGHRASANALRDALDVLYPVKIH